MARRRKKTSSAISWWHDIKADYTRFKKWNAKRIKANNAMAKERAKASAESAQAKLERDQRRAKSRADADRRKAERAAQARNRKAAAETRAQQTAARPQVVKARVVTTPTAPAARVSVDRKTAARPTREAIAAGATQQCGARCDDGTPCQNPTVGGPCAAGHTPKGRPTQAKNRKPSVVGGSGYTPLVIGRTSSRTTSGGPPPAATGTDGPQRSSGGSYTSIVTGNARVGVQAHTVNGPLRVQMGAGRVTPGYVAPPNAPAADFTSTGHYVGPACRCCTGHHGRQMGPREHCSSCAGHRKKP